MTIIELDHTADIRFRITAVNIHDLFKESAKALMGVMYSGQAGSQISRKFSIKAENLHELLSMFLSEILYLSDAENIVFSGFDISIDDTYTTLSADLSGDPFIRKNHGGGSEVKGISLYGLEIKDKDGMYIVDLLFDV